MISTSPIHGHLQRCACTAFLFSVILCVGQIVMLLQCPWLSMRGQFGQPDIRKRIGRFKEAMSLEVLCKDLPTEFLKYLKHCTGLAYAEKPDYDYLRKLFSDLFQQEGELGLSTLILPRYDAGLPPGPTFISKLEHSYHTCMHHPGPISSSP